ncbi:MAG TPA: type II toxin-antitoxin system HicB family antitoxin [Candidatus Polarisedimenticolaceae bacterium]|nr:type II toxin-antitoxin system HicB family antitoxin [Candidatus Polarisedimenticolaceae bacterium]
MKLQVVLEPLDEGGFAVVVPALPGCVGEGQTRDEALRNIEDAIRLYLEQGDDEQLYGPEAELLEIAL